MLRLHSNICTQVALNFREFSAIIQIQKPSPRKSHLESSKRLRSEIFTNKSYKIPKKKKKNTHKKGIKPPNGVRDVTKGQIRRIRRIVHSGRKILHSAKIRVTQRRPIDSRD